MIIIIEGADGTGKTSLAKQLADQTGYRVVHMSYPKNEDERAEMFNNYKRILESGKNLILDRSWYSECVYGPAMRGGSCISASEMYALEAIAARKGAMIIHCTGGGLAKSYHRAHARGEDYVTTIERHTDIYVGFNSLFKGCPHYIPVTTYEF